jgi:hypothetical protein
VGLAGVIAAGQTIQHMDKIAFALAGHDPDTSKSATLRALVRSRPVWVTPTLASLRAMDLAGTAEYSDRLRTAAANGVDSATLGWWRTLDSGRRQRPAAGSAHFQYQSFLLNVLRAERVPLLLGTDTGNPLMVAGFAVHDELEALVTDAKLRPYDALLTATANVGKFLGEPQTGTVHVGATANLVLVDGNPLSDLSLLRRPAGVMVGGTWLDRARLDALLRESVR